MYEPQSHLTKSQRVVFGLIMRGLSNKEIAGKVFTSEKTVKFHVTKIFRKELVKTRGQLISKYHKSPESLESLDYLKLEIKPELHPLCDHLMTLAKSMQLIEQQMKNVNAEIRFILKNDLVSREKSGYRELIAGRDV